MENADISIKRYQFVDLSYLTNTHQKYSGTLNLLLKLKEKRKKEGKKESKKDTHIFFTNYLTEFVLTDTLSQV
jgi:hypothetical protein